MTHFYQLWMTFLSDCPPDREGTRTPERGFSSCKTALTTAVLLSLVGCSGLNSKPSNSSTAPPTTSASATQTATHIAPNNTNGSGSNQITPAPSPRQLLSKAIRGRLHPAAVVALHCQPSML